MMTPNAYPRLAEAKVSAVPPANSLRALPKPVSLSNGGVRGGTATPAGVRGQSPLYLSPRIIAISPWWQRSRPGKQPT